MLAPDNLTRYGAHWLAPDPTVADVVDQYWYVSWNLGDQSVDQRIIDAPAVTLTVEEGDVPAPLVITGVQARAWHRTIQGRGRVFAIRLRPAGLAVLGALSPQCLANTALPLTEELDAELHALMRRVAAHPTPRPRPALRPPTRRSGHGWPTTGPRRAAFWPTGWSMSCAPGFTGAPATPCLRLCTSVSARSSAACAPPWDAGRDGWGTASGSRRWFWHSRRALRLTWPRSPQTSASPTSLTCRAPSGPPAG